MNKLIRFICRVIPGIVFIFSGLVKAVDPMGGAIKFEDYFTAFHLGWLAPFSLTLSLILAAVEFLLGFHLLLGLYIKKLAPFALLLMSVFFFLTLYIAIFNPVSDCGCFGEALKLTNWQTFGKNAVLIIFTIGLFKLRKDYPSPTSKIRMVVTTLLLTIYIFALGFWSIQNLPVIDFRPFRTGTHIASQMEIPEGAERPELETLFTLEKNGLRKTFSVNDYPYDDTTWVFIDTETRVIKEGYQPPLHDFSLLDPDLGEATQDVVNRGGAQFLLIAPRLQKMEKSVILPLTELAELARQKNIPFYCVTASGSAETMEFDLTNKTMFRYLQSDETTLKTIIRSNPGLVMLVDGTIAGKWHYRNLPDKSIVNNPLAYAIQEMARSNEMLIIWINLLIMILIPIVTINRKTIK